MVAIVSGTISVSSQNYGASAQNVLSHNATPMLQLLWDLKIKGHQHFSLGALSSMYLGYSYHEHVIIQTAKKT